MKKMISIRISTRTEKLIRMLQALGQCDKTHVIEEAIETLAEQEITPAEYHKPFKAE